jgi:uncharacterized protein
MMHEAGPSRPLLARCASLAAPAPASSTAEVPPHWNVNFQVAEADAVAEHASALGGRVLMAPFDTLDFRNAAVTDPQGAVFSISHLTASR